MNTLRRVQYIVAIHFVQAFSLEKSIEPNRKLVVPPRARFKHTTGPINRPERTSLWIRDRVQPSWKRNLRCGGGIDGEKGAGARGKRLAKRRGTKARGTEGDSPSRRNPFPKKRRRRRKKKKNAGTKLAFVRSLARLLACSLVTQSGQRFFQELVNAVALRLLA